MNIYVIDPVTGIKDDNRAEFERVRNALRLAGYKAKMPHDFIDVTATWSEAMRISIREMLRQQWSKALVFKRPVYDGIAMLDGWEDSKGATIEHDLAVSLGIPCRPWREWL